MAKPTDAELAQLRLTPADFEDEAGSAWFQWDGPEGTFHDSGQTRVSVLSTGSIGDWDRRRFRGNVIIDSDTVGAENEPVGQRITIGTVSVVLARIRGETLGRMWRVIRCQFDPPSARLRST